MEKYGHKGQYLLTLRFIPRLTDDEYEAIRTTRDEAIQKIRSDSTIDGKRQYSLVEDEKKKHPLPEYRNVMYSVFADRPTLTLYPVQAAEEVKQVLHIISSLLEKYPEPSSANVSGWKPVYKT